MPGFTRDTRLSPRNKRSLLRLLPLSLTISAKKHTLGADLYAPARHTDSSKHVDGYLQGKIRVRIDCRACILWSSTLIT